jgi:hypothetical protein
MKHVSFNDASNEVFVVVVEERECIQQIYDDWTAFGVMMREQGLASYDTSEDIYSDIVDSNDESDDDTTSDENDNDNDTAFDF